MPEQAIADRVQAVRRFNRFYTRRIGVLRQGLLDSDFTLTEVRVLFELAQGPTTASDLVQNLDLDPGYVSRILGSFEDDGLVTRTQAETDRRQWTVTLTTRGRRAFETLDTRSSAQIDAMLAMVSDEDQHRLVSAMDAIQHVLAETAPDKEPPAPFILRSHRPGDIGLVTYRHGVVYAQEQGFDEDFETLVAEILVKFVRDHDPQREHLWIAERDGVFAGSIMCVAASKSVAQLRLLLVEPSARGHGLGGHLVDECMRFARQAGYRKMTLWTQGCLNDARRVYERAGFTLSKRQPHESFSRKLEAQWWECAL